MGPNASFHQITAACNVYCNAGQHTCPFVLSCCRGEPRVCSCSGLVRIITVLYYDIVFSSLFYPPSFCRNSTTAIAYVCSHARSGLLQRKMASRWWHRRCTTSLRRTAVSSASRLVMNWWVCLCASLLPQRMHTAYVLKHLQPIVDVYQIISPLYAGETCICNVFLDRCLFLFESI